MQEDTQILSDGDVELYARQLVLKGWDELTQAKLLSAHIAIIGVGGLGMPVLSYLAGAGVGHITLVEPDKIDKTNLHRQHIPTLSESGTPKIEPAKRFVKERFSNCNLTCHETALTEANADSLLEGCSLVLDCTDRLDTRLMIAHIALKRRIPHIFAGAIRHEGQISVFAPYHSDFQGSACFGCIFPSEPDFAQAPSCAQAGISGPVVGMIGAMQANEALKLLTGIGTPLIGRLLLVDAATPRFDEIKTSQQSQCKICADKRH